MPELTNPTYAQMIRGAFARAQEHGYTVLAAEDFDEQRADAVYGELVAAGHVDGILMAIALERLGRTAVDALIAQIGGAEPADVVVPDEPRVVLRGSTAAPSRP